MKCSLETNRPLGSRCHQIAIILFLLIGFIAVLFIVSLSQVINRESREISAASGLRGGTGSVLVSLIDMGMAERSYYADKHDENLNRVMIASQELDKNIFLVREMVAQNFQWADWYNTLDKEVKLVRDNIIYHVEAARSTHVQNKSSNNLPPQRPEAGKLHELMEIFDKDQQGDILGQQVRIDRSRSAIITCSFVVLISALIIGFLLVSHFRRQVKQLTNHRDFLNEENEHLGQRVAEKANALEKERKHAEKERARVELLLQDTSHRIGNSLAMVSSLLNLQSNRTDNEEVRAELISARDRILTISSAHRRLRLNDDMERSEVKDFLTNVVSDVQMGVMGERYKHITISSEFANYYVVSRDVTTLGIILGELLTNAIKHAFSDGREGMIEIFFGHDEDGSLQLIVEDNGVGIKVAEESSNKKGLGQLVVRQLCMQFGEEPIYEAGAKGGTKVVVYLPELKIYEPDEEELRE